MAAKYEKGAGGADGRSLPNAQSLDMGSFLGIGAMTISSDSDAFDSSLLVANCSLPNSDMSATSNSIQSDGKLRRYCSSLLQVLVIVCC